MTPEPGPRLFRETSLERLSSPERLDLLLRAVDRKSWLPLATLAALVGVLGVWSVVGTVPVNVHGSGILVHPRAVAELRAPGDGTLAELTVAVDDRVAPGQVLGRLDRPDLVHQLERQRGKARELAEQLRAYDSLRASGSPIAAEGFARGSDDLVATRDLARGLRDKEQRSIEQERLALEAQHRIAREHAEALARRLADQRVLQAGGFVAHEAVLEAEARYMDRLARVADLETEIQRLVTRELESDERYLERIERVGEREQQLADLEREIERLETLLAQESLIVSDRGGQVLELSALPGEYLERGDRIGAVAAGDEAGPLVGLSYFTVGDGKRLKEGMRIQITPATVERERYGGIKGTITEISTLPVTLAEVEQVVGSREMAEALVAGGRHMQVYATLDRDPSTASGFHWSSSTGPEQDVTAGTTATVRVAVESRPPITFVLPYLKSSAGID